MAYQKSKGFRIVVIISVFLTVFLICGCNVLDPVENEIPNNTAIKSTESPPLLQEFLATPENQTASVGSFVKFICIVSNKRGSLRWTKDFKELGNLSSHPRYAIVGDRRKGEFSLLIKNVTIQDEGLYSCQVGPGTAKEDFGLFSYVYLTVEVPPGPPVITLESYPSPGQAHGFDSQIIILKCVSLHGKPPPEVTWLDPKGQIAPDAAVNTKHLLRYSNSAGKNVDSQINVRATISFYTLKVVKEDNGKNISCQIRSKMFLNKFPPSPISTFILLNISFPPQITLRFEIKSSKEPTHYLQHSWVEPGIREMDLVKLVCRGSANPPAEFSWLINNERVEILGNKMYDIIGTRIIEDKEQQISTLFLPDVTRRLHNSTVQCEAHNWAGSSTVSKTLYIKVQVPIKPETNSAVTHLGIKLGVGLGVPAVIIAIIVSVAVCIYSRSRYSQVQSDDGQIPLRDLLQGPIDLGSSLRSDLDATLTRQPKVEAAPAPETHDSEV